MVKLYRYRNNTISNNPDLILKVAIKEKTPPVSNYSIIESSGKYICTVNTRKTLDEYQIRYVTEGEGTYEDATGEYFVGSGTLIIIKPGVVHKYAPSPDTGWVENYLELNWPLAELILDKVLSCHNKPVFDIGIKEDIIEAYHQIIELSNQEDQQIQQHITGIVLKLLGVILTTNEQCDGSLERLESIIHQTCFFVKRNVDKNIDFKKIAFDNNLGYEHFRKIFKQIIGIPPGQYHLQLKIDAARKMLLSTNKSVKEISYDLGFESVYYFCRLFKKKMGITPSQAREELVLA